MQRIELHSRIMEAAKCRASERKEREEGEGLKQNAQVGH